MKRTLTLRSERLAELTVLGDDELGALVGASGRLCPEPILSVLGCPTVPDVNTCNSVFC